MGFEVRLPPRQKVPINHYISGSEIFKKTLNLSAFGVKAPEPDVVEFILSRPSAIFLKQLAVADCAILSLDDFKKDPDLSARGAFSGPYKVEKSLADGEVTIEKWRKDALDSPRPPAHVTYFMTDEKPVVLALASKTDTLDHDRLGDADRAKLQSLGWSPTPTELSGEVFVVLNPDKLPEAARKILFASVSANDLIRAIRRDSYRPAFGLIPFGVPGALSEDDVKGIIGDSPEPLKQSVTIRLDFEQGSDLELKIAEFLKVRWSKFNIQVSFNPLPKAEKLKHLFGKTSQAIIGRKTVDYPDGFSVLGYFKGNYESNYFFVNDPVVDSALSEILQVFDFASREARYRDVQKMILKHWTLIPLLFGSEASGFWSSKVRSVPAHPLGYHMLPVETIEMKEDR
jgi:ABC-type transport system substrate-binding protein